MSEARRIGGLRAAEKRAEARSRFLDEVERVDPFLLPLARKLEARVVPYRPEGWSRVEWFHRYVEENPSRVIEAIEEGGHLAWPEPEPMFTPGSVVLTLCESDFNPRDLERTDSFDDRRMALQWIPAVVVDGVVRGNALTLAESGERFEVPVSMVRFL